jgi:hypothetical protein
MQVEYYLKYNIYMPHDYLLHHIRISISTLNKYVRINKQNKNKKKNICTD